MIILLFSRVTLSGSWNKNFERVHEYYHERGTE